MTIASMMFSSLLELLIIRIVSSKFIIVGEIWFTKRSVIKMIGKELSMENESCPTELIFLFQFQDNTRNLAEQLISWSGNQANVK